MDCCSRCCGGLPETSTAQGAVSLLAASAEPQSASGLSAASLGIFASSSSHRDQSPRAAPPSAEQEPARSESSSPFCVSKESA
eukprot:CAMPEP_0171251138 /NCGR_PEP_ID=MMETSP0790-20130122/50480_1 /TAXON_ID=2925 /ORGANISM="Alexandrium catenella, Strain OF101" /LENGTH=82 /DNA_ID=CAMNT_0011718817 /DNA_START=20 /DNA_END=265 /DNA_ORIENTATION=+